jgi:hypothetical protein
MLMGYRASFGMSIAESAPSYVGPMNQLHSKAQTMDHTFKEVITPNADTPYSTGILDLRAEPVVLQVPEVTDRYYVMQMEDLYGFNAHYVGSRATGSDAGTYVLAGPGWDGAAPEGVTDVLRFETDLVVVIGRTQMHGTDDVPALTAVMDQYHLEPLSTFLDEPAPALEPFDWPIWDDPTSRDERFIGYVNALLQLCQPPHPDEVDLLARLATIGISPGEPFDATALTDEQRTALAAGVDQARKKMAARADRLGEVVNGWQAVAGFGDRDFFGGDYLLRAASAMAGWGGNDRKEAFYPIARVDAEGKPLSSDHRYRLTLTSPPPAKAFWSVTMYDTSYDGTAGYLAENPIGRYVINDTSQGLVLGEDGALSIAIQHEKPESTADIANWLPAPDGPFYVALRIYWPEEAAFDGTWEPPPVERID